MYSMAQHAVAKGYGKIEYLRAQPIALSSCVSTTASPSSASSPEVATRGLGGAMGLATCFVYPGARALVKGGCVRRERGIAGARHGSADALDPPGGGRRLPGLHARRRAGVPTGHGGGAGSRAAASAPRARAPALQRALGRRAR